MSLYSSIMKAETLAFFVHSFIHSFIYLLHFNLAVFPICDICMLSINNYDSHTGQWNTCDTLKNPKKTCQRWWESNHTLHEENVGLPRSVQAARISSTSMNLLLYWRIKTRIIHKLYNTLTTHGCVRVVHQSRATRSQVWHRSKKKKTEYNRIRVAQFQQPGSWFLNRVISQLTTDKWILKYSGHSNLMGLNV